MENHGQGITTENEDKIEEEIENGQEENEEIEEEYEEQKLEYSNADDLVQELEREFQMMHDHDTANKLIEIYKDADDFVNVRRIRETLLEYNTLTENQWMEWITDEKSFAKTNEEKKAVLKLFDRALEDALYYDIAKFAVKYVKYLYSEGIVRKQGVSITIGKLINYFCFDFNRGSKFFKKLREFEMENKESTNEQEKAKVIRNLYERQLKLPLADINQTLESYITWETNQEEKKRIAALYDDTYKDITTHLDIEESFQSVNEPFDSENYKNVMKNILANENLKLEKKINLLERSVELNYSEPEVWDVYVEFAYMNIKVNDSLERIYKRALKNCPSNIDFATKYLRILEKRNTELEELKRKALMMLVNFTEVEHYYQLRLLLCEIFVRALNTKIIEVKGNLNEAKHETILFRQAVQEAIEFFSGGQPKENQTYISNLWLFKAHIETYTLKDKKEMNVCMDNFVKINGSQYFAWYQYVIFEQAVGRPSTVRTILKKGCEYTKDDIHSMFKFAIDYERKFGSLEDLEAMEKRYQERLVKLAQEGEIIPEQAPQSNNLFRTVEKPNQRVANKKEKLKDKKRRNKEEPVPTVDDAFYKDLKHDKKKPRIQVPSKQDKIEEEKTPETQPKVVTIKAAKSTMEEEKQENIENQAQAEKDDLNKEPPAYPNYLDTRNTVFIKNFPLSFEEQDVIAIFHNADKITGCRIVKDKTEKSKGIAYVDFVNPEEAGEACKSDGVEIDGKKLYVALSDPPKKGKEDRKTLFVNNLPFKVTKQMIEDAFNQEKRHIKEIRIPLKPDGDAKGFAYLTFDTENAANAAVEKHKNLDIGGRTVKVEHADSSKKHHDQVLKALNVIFLKGLNFKASEQDIRDFFKDFDIKQVKLVVDKKSGKSKGFAFVEFQTLEDLRRALSIPEPTILGRTFTITRSERPITDDQHEEGNKEQKKNKTALSRKDAEKQDPQEEKTPPRSNIKPQEKKEEAPKTMLSNKDFLAFLKKK